MPAEVDVSELERAQREGRGVVVDVREPDEHAGGHVPGARLVPLGELEARASQLPRDERLYVICASGHRSAAAADWLTEAGFDAVSVAGGTQAWAQAGQPLAFAREEDRP